MKLLYHFFVPIKQTQGGAKSFLESFKFRLVEGQDLSYKMLPISRPREDVEVHLTRLSKESDKDSSR